MKQYRSFMNRAILLLIISLVFAGALNTTGFANCSIASDLPAGFVYAPEYIPGLVFEPRYYSDNNFTGQRVAGYLAPVCIMTLEAAIELRGVQLELKRKGLALKIFDAYRPQQAVDCFVAWAKDISDQKEKARYYPTVDKKDLFRDGYIASPSSHSRGSAVDLTVVQLGSDGTYRELDMGTGFDYFGTKAWPTSKDVTSAQYNNRMLLRDAMIHHGFVPYDWEWWHFRLADEPFPDTCFDFPVE